MSDWDDNDYEEHETDDEKTQRRRRGIPSQESQQDQIDNVCRDAGLNNYQRNQLHRELNSMGGGHHMSYQELLELAYQIKNEY